MSWTAPASPPDSAALREAIYGKRAPVRNDLVALLEIARDGDEDPDLLGLVGDVACDALAPEGALSDLDADWLIEVCGDRRGVPGRAEFAALMAVARIAPTAELVAFAAREIERAILTGERRRLGAEDCEPGRVTARDVQALRALSAFAPPDRAMAEVLFDIAHATATADNHPSFDALFAESLWAYLTGEIPAGARFDEFLAALDAAPESFETSAPLDGLADGGYDEVAQGACELYEAAASLSAGGATWALAHLSRGALSPAERRLVASLRAPALHHAA